MGSISRATAPLQVRRIIGPPIFLHWSQSSLNVTNHGMPRVFALKVGSQDVYGPDFLRKPVVSQPEDEKKNTDGSRSEWVDWEDQILEDTMPLIGFVRMVLHSNKYKIGDRLSPEHENIILEKLLPYHPGYEKKIGSGIDYIMVGLHPDFGDTRCLFIAQKNGELVDFSYWKCIKGMIRKKYPSFAESFILRHFRRHRRGE